jgi:RNA polymerase sigma-70 factor, ECF subfamily
MATLEDDRALASRIQRGDPQAVETFVSRYGPKIIWLAGRHGIPPNDRQDVAQEVLASAISQIERGVYRGIARLGTWLEPIIRGKVADYKRSSSKRPIPGAAVTDAIRNELSSISKELISLPEQEALVLVREVFQSLPKQHRFLLILNKIENRGIAEISLRLGWPKGTVGRLLANAQQKFRERIASREEFPNSARQRIDSGEE